MVCVYVQRDDKEHNWIVWERWSEKEKWCLSKLTRTKPRVDIIEECDRSKLISGKTKDGVDVHFRSSLF